ncbi:MAG: tripartite tricarboxylate transporter substrate binding protein [Burkholderiales bacterium]|nr:tripartite tricarboxylate transporter substrate binding protein [Burkholderiales bacterium]
MVPAAGGGSASSQAGVLAEAAQRHAGRPFILDHRSGWGEHAAAAVVSRSPADGTVVLFATAGLAVRAAGAGAAGAEVLRRLRPVGQVSEAPLVLAVHPVVPARTPAGLVALARVPPGRLRAGAGTPGGLSHLAAAMLLPAAAAAHIMPFRGGGPALQALGEGRIDMLFAAAPAVLPHWVAGRVRMLAVTAASPHAGLARLPLLGGTASDPAVLQWHALFVPGDTPDHVVAGLQRGMHRSLRDDAVAAYFAEHAVAAVGGDGAALEALLQREIARYAPLIRRAAMVP